MDWEIYEKYRSTVLLAALLLCSSLLLAFRQSSGVRAAQSILVKFALPPQRFLVIDPVATAYPVVIPDGAAVPTPDGEGAAGALVSPQDSLAELRRKIQTLTEENTRLRSVLQLKSERWPKAVPAHVVGRDPQRWFQEIVLDKGSDDGLRVDDPVIAVDGSLEGLIGRVTETSAHVAKVMLLQDSLSSVAAEVRGPNGEDGLVEGGNTHELYLRYLDRGSQVKIGDLVVTSGLGQVFPAGAPIGVVQSVEPDPRQLFLQATLQPVVRSSALRVVLVIPMNRSRE